jgi:hypothetical protein
MARCSAYYIALWGLADKGSLGIRLGGRLGRRLEDRDVGWRAGFRSRMNSVVWMDNVHLPSVEIAGVNSMAFWSLSFSFFPIRAQRFCCFALLFSLVLLWVLVLVCCF